MQTFNFHTHSNFSDGRASQEEMIEAAIAAGFTALGFSEHSYVESDPDYNIPRSCYQEYQETTARLKEKYKGRIRLFCGLEQDLQSEPAGPGFDYFVGSCHYVRVGDRLWSVDRVPEELAEGRDVGFGGDIYALLESYFEDLAKIPEVTHANILGHFDMPVIFNGNGEFFDENHPRYVAAWQKAADKLLASGIIFEVNTSGIRKGLRKEPYPAGPIYRYLKEHGGRFILSSDAHAPEQICYGFKEWGRLAALSCEDLVK